MIPCWLLALATVSAAAAQIAPSRFVVATRVTGSRAATVLLEVDPGGGAIANVSRFAADAYPPLAIGIDPVNRDVIVVVADEIGSRVVRLRLSGLAVIAERPLTTVPGIVGDLAFGPSEIVLTTGAGVWSVARNGGPPASVATLPRAAALARGFLPGQIVVVQSGEAPATDPAVFSLDLDTMRLGAGSPMVGYRPFGITGHVWFQNALGFNYFANDDGTVSAGVGLIVPHGAPLPLTPALGPGAAMAMRRDALKAVVLGDRRNPFLKTFRLFDLTNPQPWQILAGPLPGDPVDFWIAEAAAATLIPFGRACAWNIGPLQVGTTSAPTVGNSAFQLELRGAPPGQLAALALGVSDQLAAGGPLPFPLPGGCWLSVSTESATAHTTDAQGRLQVAVPIPNDSRLIGAIAYAQWVAPEPGGALATSAAAAIHVH